MSYSIDPLIADCYPGTSVLINKLDIRAEAALASAEAELVTYEELGSGLVQISYSNGFQAYVNPFSETLSEGEIVVDGYSFRFFDSTGAEL